MPTPSDNPLQQRLALTIGAFDGVHLGHQALIKRARGVVLDEGHVEVLTFDPAPAIVLAGGGVHAGDQGVLMSLETRRSQLLLAGADEVTVIEVDRELLSLSPEAFIDNWLRPRAPQVVVEGTDFRFGKGRSGGVDLIQSTLGCSIETVDEMHVVLGDGTQVPARSGMVRWLLRAGRVQDAALLLGRPWQLEGTVVEGAKRGRTIGVPTANLDTANRLVPMDGVYRGVAHLPEGSSRAAAVSVGTNATFGPGARTIEVHMLDFDGQIGHYGWPLRVELTGWIRDQVTCSDVESLMQLIRRDLDQVRALHESRDYPVGP
ncbi:MAG: hypothetical protein MK101_02955 [Phycisphaerales bacterium]|nr:hypothetical protein [Phycisphaerales bacterium]